MPLKYSTNFGGNASDGNAATDAGIDCIIVVNGGPQSIAISRVIAHYGLSTINDWELAAVAGWRSFSGRLIIAEVRPDFVLENLTTGGPPSPFLSTRLPDTFAQRILFDKMIHEFPMTETHFEFDLRGNKGVLRSGSGLGLAVVLIAGSGFDNAGVQTYFTRQFLHVEAEIVSISQDVQIGRFSTKQG